MKRRTLLQALLACGLLPGTAAAVVRPLPAGTGLLLLAHGSNDERWNAQVRDVAAQVDARLPTEVAFGMASRATIAAAIERLRRRGVAEIVAVPLFVSSHSSVIESSAYLLGLRAEAPADLAMFAAMDHGGGHGHHDGHMQPTAEATTPIQVPLPVRMVPALDHHPLVAAILHDRAASISRDPARETVLLVAHGPVSDAEDQQWLQDMRQLADAVRALTPYAAIDALTLRDDAGPAVREAATQRLRARLQQAHAAGTAALVVPLLLSYGGIEQGLRERLDGLDYRLPAQALLPDPRITDWVLQSAGVPEPA